MAGQDPSAEDPRHVPETGSAAPRPEPEQLDIGETWTWAVLLTLTEFAPAIVGGIAVVTTRGGSVLTGVLAVLSGVAVMARTGALDDGGTHARRSRYRNWRRARVVGVLTTWAVAFTPLGWWLGAPWRSLDILPGLWWGIGLSVVAVIGWLFHAGDQVIAGYGTPFGRSVDLLVAPFWLVRALTAHGLLPLLLGIALDSAALLVAGFCVCVTEYLLARRTAVIVSRTNLWDLVHGRQSY
ncbi:hypothetical protein [Plantactinospora sp. WMMB782]|uniref:hypothetical protein n=1 Tax=Plantactinospora sp. WMMB782 TaxID=3404121 RepID=UPI003B95FDF5